MNINLTLPEGSAERLVAALERIAAAAERIAGPPAHTARPEPYDAAYWGYTDNATSRATEEEDRRAAQGFGPDYEKALEYAAAHPAGPGAGNNTER